MKICAYLLVVGILFSVIAILHALRLVYGWDVVIGGVAVPAWASGVGLIVAGALSGFAFHLRQSQPDR